MTSISFPRPTKALLNLNDRHHWARKAADVRAWRLHAFTAAYAADAGLPVMARHGFIETYNPRKAPSMVCITCDVPDSRRRDPANVWVQKPIVDGLVDAGWWPDDTPEWVTVVEPVLRVTKDRPLMVTVELLPR